MNEDPPSLADLGRELGVSAMAVSLALRGSARVSESLRLRARSLADRRGYRVDPVLSSLGSRRWRRAGGRRSGEMGYVVCGDARHGGLGSGSLTLAEAAREAGRLGHGLQVYEVGTEAAARRVRRQMEARGAAACLLGDLPLSMARVFTVAPAFPVVEVGIGHSGVAAHRVEYERGRDVRRFFRLARESGKRRIGVVVLGDPGADDHAEIVAAVRLENGQQRRPVPELLLDVPRPFEECVRTMAAWFRRHRPDAVLGHNRLAYSALITSGVEIPRAVAYASLVTIPTPQSPREDLAGFVESAEALARAAVALADQLARRRALLLGDDGTIRRVVLARRLQPGASFPGLVGDGDAGVR
jgi:DNA-binding LacI/PurR family transcriptional regulator